MEWIPLTEKQPEKKGKYIVTTLTTMGNIHRFEARYHGGGKWSVSNQKVTHWLSE